MSIKFRNKEISAIANMLNSLSLKGKASRGRTKLIKRLAEKEKDFQEDLDEIRKKYFKVDEQGDFIFDREEKLIYKDDSQKEALIKEIQELQDEEAIIDTTEIKNKLSDLYQGLDSYDEKLSGQDALIYDLIMDVLETEGD